VIGGGSFGLALSSICGQNGHKVTILVRSAADAEHINEHRRHPKYIKDVTLPDTVSATTDPTLAFSNCTLIVHAIPVQHSRTALTTYLPFIPPNVPILSGSKGIETTSLGFMADIFTSVLGTDRSYAFLSGPSFAREMMLRKATAVVVASDDQTLSDSVADLLSSSTFRVFTSRDVVGVEVGGATKNVIAVAAGMCEGLGLGANAVSGLVTRGCGEMRRLGMYLGAQQSTLSGLSGVGDTFGTCFGPLSRNRDFGVRLGRGESVEEILESTTEVAEGVGEFSLCGPEGFVEP